MQLDTARIFVSDIYRARPFYQDALGLPLEADGSQDGFLLFRAGPMSLVVETSPPQDTVNGETLVGRFTGLSFRVDDIHQSYAKMMQSGVQFIRPPEHQPWGGWTVSFRDGDDNVLSLVQLPT